MAESSTTWVGGICRGDEFSTDKGRAQFAIGSEWTCPYRAIESTPDGEIEYGCAMKFTRVSANKVNTVTGRVCLRQTMQEHPNDWEAQICSAPQPAA